MLSLKHIYKVRWLLSRQKCSQRKIQKRTGVSRITVQRIAAGEWHRYKNRPKEAWDVDWESKDRQSFERCPVCKTKTKLPCLACAVRTVHPKKSADKRKTEAADSRLWGELNLRPEHQKRYEQVKAWREAQDNPHFIDIPEGHPLRSSEELLTTHDDND